MTIREQSLINLSRIVEKSYEIIYGKKYDRSKRMINPYNPLHGMFLEEKDEEGVLNRNGYYALFINFNEQIANLFIMAEKQRKKTFRKIRPIKEEDYPPYKVKS